MLVEPKRLKEYPWYLRPFFWNQRRHYGKVLKPGLLWARSPLVFMGVALLYGAINRRRSPLSPVLRSLVTVRISQINWCAFCVDINTATLQKRGVPMNKIVALEHWQDSPLFDEQERVALAYAEAMTRSGMKIDDELQQEVRRLFPDDALVELTALISFQNLSSKFNAALGVPAEGFCKVPSKDLH
jgi:AhpD family alkylhydroperoxidase